VSWQFSLVSLVRLRQDAVLDSLRAELIPKHGQQTDYGIPLDLRNAAQFVDWFYTIELDESKQALKDSALGVLVARIVDRHRSQTTPSQRDNRSATALRDRSRNGCVTSVTD
jgi:hypothetical protein